MEGEPLARQPLQDATNRANIPQLPLQRTRHSPFLTSLEKLHHAHSDATPPESTDSPVTIVHNKRISAVTDPQPRSSNRNSAISTASTGSGKSRRKTHIGPWQLGRTLGKGSTSRVRLAKHAITGQSAAIKIVSKKSAALIQSQSIVAMDRNSRVSSPSPGSRTIPCGIEREVVIMKLINHPNIISLLDVWENRGELYLVLEYVEGGELFEYISENGPLPEVEAVRLFRQILAGISYCHQINICHRDLKPENILLDENHNAKIADFGMAALQPVGHLLNTSCGSPHYASPEILYGKRYQGEKVDIWSCGVILFALLAGFLPFDGGDLPNTLDLVKRGEYVLPPWMSADAADLIQRILQKRPEDRIPMQDIWSHPLLKRYESRSWLAQRQLDNPSPPVLSLQSCEKVVSRSQDIDMDILRSLQTLWHGVTGVNLIRKLLNDEPNFEKMFYRILHNFKQKQSQPDDGQPLEHSSSDYHHLHYRKESLTRLSSFPASSRPRRQSMTSFITNLSSHNENEEQERRPSRNSSSYDPFRSSKTPVVDPQVAHANITIHRNAPRLSNNGSSPPAPRSASQRHSSISSFGPNSSFNPLPFKASQRGSLMSFQSSSSIASYRQRAKPFGPKHPYKRNVNFRHFQYPSGQMRNKTSNSNSKYSLSPNSSTATPNLRALSPDRFSTPSLPTPPQLVRKRRDPGLRIETETAKARMSWREDARKVSAELGKLCEEAFKSTYSELATGSTTNDEHSDSPPTSVSSQSDILDFVTTSGVKTLEPPMLETSQNYAARELTETRRRLIEHSTQAGAEGLPEYLKEVISHLDRLIDGETTVRDESNINQLSLTPQTPPGHLPVISEENNAIDDLGSPKDTSKKPSCEYLKGKKSIRVVSEGYNTDDVQRIKPLTIRKNKKVTPLELESHIDFSDFPMPCTTIERDVVSLNTTSRTGSQPPYNEGLVPNGNERLNETRNTKGGEIRKWSWFPYCRNGEGGHSVVSSVKQEEDRTIAPECPDSRRSKTPLGQIRQRMKTFQPSQPNGRFRRFWSGSKKTGTPIHELAHGIHDPDSSGAASIVSQAGSKAESEIDLESVALELLSMDAARGIKPWIPKFLHIKPATKVFALSLSKARAKKETIRILQGWKRYGLEDLFLDKHKSTLHGSVGELNCLRLRPVKFSAEFYTVLEFGHPADLSLIRLRLEQGATSTFNKLAKALGVELKRQDYLVQNTRRARNMTKVLNS
ncbi:hypothetical protein FQN57_000793 [Myotisia sp. PD_48]|nr:hypothetical protein FQN57_000793 [Myotisia sp. PD_48]